MTIFRKPNKTNVLQSPIKDLVSSPFTQHTNFNKFKYMKNGNSNFAMNPKNAKSPTSKMLVMSKNSQKGSQYSNYQAGGGYKHIHPETIKSKKVINFDDYSHNSDQYK